MGAFLRRAGWLSTISWLGVVVCFEYFLFSQSKTDAYITSALEIFAAFFIYAALPCQRLIGKILKFSFGLVLLFSIIIQMQLLRASGDFLTTIALSNIGTLSSIGLSWDKVLPFVIIGVVLLVDSFLLRNKERVFSYYCFVLSFLFFAVIWSGIKIVNRMNGCQLKAPIYTAVSTLINAKNERARFDDIKKDFDDHRKYYLSRFERNKIYGTGGKIINKNHPNVIVFFTEGMSARFIGKYGSKYSDLTPFIDKLYSESLVFNNYYNHTAATFRGLRGQMVSGYQYNGGYHANGGGIGQISSDEVKKQTDNKYIITLPDVLKKNGYSTSFVSADEKGSQMEALLRCLRFDSVYMAGDFKQNNATLTDRELFEALWHTVQEKGKERAPFMIATYNFGTHAAVDSPDFKYGDGKNIGLNRFHNFDVFFGLFMEKLKSSEFGDNTIVIFTTDHATYPGPEIVAADNSVPPYFVDRVPFIVYYKGAEHSIVNVKGRNSLNFTPTVLNMLGFNEEKNYFLGCSLFTDECPEYNNMFVLEYSYFVTDEEGVHPVNEKDENIKSEVLEAIKMVEDDYRITSN